jgi:hypothetical protein
MTTALPRASDSFCASKRAAMSMLPPADWDTTNFTGWLGQGAVCAKAVLAAKQSSKEEKSFMGFFQSGKSRNKGQQF